MKKSFNDKIILVFTGLIGIIAILDSANSLPSLFGDIDYFKIFIILISLCILYFITKFKKP